MFRFLFSFFSLIINLFDLSSDRSKLVVELAILKKENEILKRNLNVKKKVKSNLFDKFFYVLLYPFSFFRSFFSLFKPSTILKWYHNFLKSRWIFPHKSKPVGRPSVSNEIRELIRDMKNKNILWFSGKIQGELKKLKIDLSTQTIRNILNLLRKQGKINDFPDWKTFLFMHAKTIIAMDFLTVETFSGGTFYVHFIISHKNREIIQFSITKNPVREFVRQQIIKFEETVNRLVYLIHDNAAQFFLKYACYNIKDIRISFEAPNMNAIAERFVGTLRRECLDWFIILNEKHLRTILSDYIRYYNSQRPHQGINQQVPLGYDPASEGQIRSSPILGGLHHHYFRSLMFPFSA